MKDDQRPIVVGTDGSPRAERAVAAAATLARLASAPLHIVTSADKQASEYIPRDLSPPQRERLLAEIQATSCGLMQRRVAEWAERGVAVEFHLRIGPTATVLHSVARAVDAGLIVVGNRGIDGPLGLVGRSLPHRVSRRAPCDVLLVDTAA